VSSVYDKGAMSQQQFSMDFLPPPCFTFSKCWACSLSIIFIQSSLRLKSRFIANRCVAKIGGRKFLSLWFVVWHQYKILHLETFTFHCYGTNSYISWHRLLRRNPFIVPRNEEHSRRCKFSLFTLVYQVQVYCL